MSVREKNLLKALAGLALVVCAISVIRSAHQIAANPGVSVQILGKATNTIGQEVVLARISNSTRSGYTYHYTAEALTNNSWEPGGLHHPQMMQARYLAPHASLTVELRIYDPSASLCRLKVSGGRVPAGVEENIYGFWRRVAGKPWPFPPRGIEVVSPAFDVTK